MSAPLLTCFIGVAEKIIELPLMSGVISVFKSEVAEETEERAGDSESYLGFLMRENQERQPVANPVLPYG